jgi:hypothetical protein
MDRHQILQTQSSSFLGFFHAGYVSPFATVLGIASLFTQARILLYHRRAPGALSFTGLFVQATVFTLVGVSWIFRLTTEGLELGTYTPIQAVWVWYELVGWAVIDNLEFAVVQGTLAFLVFGRKRWSVDAAAVDETTPLVRH